MTEGATRIRDWTPATGKPRIHAVSRNPRLDRGGQAVRAQMLLRLAECPRPGYRALAAEIGLSHQAVAAHVERLEGATDPYPKDLMICSYFIEHPVTVENFNPSTHYEQWRWK